MDTSHDTEPLLGPVVLPAMLTGQPSITVTQEDETYMCMHQHQREPVARQELVDHQAEVHSVKKDTGSSIESSDGEGEAKRTTGSVVQENEVTDEEGIVVDDDNVDIKTSRLQPWSKGFTRLYTQESKNVSMGGQDGEIEVECVSDNEEEDRMSHNEQQVTSHNEQEVTLHNEQDVTSHSEQVVTSQIEQEMTSHSEQEVTSNSEQVTSNSEQHVMSHNNQEVVSHSEQKVMLHNKQEVILHNEQEEVSHNEQEVVSHEQEVPHKHNVVLHNEQKVMSQEVTSQLSLEDEVISQVEEEVTSQVETEVTSQEVLEVVQEVVSQEIGSTLQHISQTVQGATLQEKLTRALHEELCKSDEAESETEKECKQSQLEGHDDAPPVQEVTSVIQMDRVKSLDVTSVQKEDQAVVPSSSVTKSGSTKKLPNKLLCDSQVSILLCKLCHFY